MNLSNSLAALLIASSLPLTACNKMSESANASEAKTNMTPFSETGNSDKSSFAWSTVATVSPSRQVEVGDHPGIVLEKFQIGGRPQRVRFLMADDRGTRRYVSGSPQDQLFQSDSKVAKAENDKWSPFGLVIEAPVNLGLAKFSDESTFNGLAVSPQLMLCAAGALRNLTDASTGRNRIYQNWQIDEINLLIKPVQHSAEAESKMAIDTKLRALNLQVSMWTRSGDCFLPSVSEIEAALDIADQRVHD